MPGQLRSPVEALDHELIVRLTRDMVAIPTQNPPGKEKPCAEFIRDTLQGWEIETELVEAPDPGRPQVVAWLRGDGAGPTLVLNGHMDTVGEGEPSAWTHSPFDPAIDGDRLYGLGSADMKGALAIGMVVLKTLKESGRRPSGTLMLQAVMGEEMDEPGTKTLLERGYRGDYAIVMEPTDLRIGPGTRGACWHRVVLTGPSLHCGLAPGDCPDVMQALARFGSDLAAHHAEVSKRTHHLLPSPGCRITRLQAGAAHNSTAGRCEFIVDRRMLPDESFEDVTRELRATLDRATANQPSVAYTLEYLAGNEPTETPLDHPLIRALQEGHRQVTGRPPEVWGPPYGSDMRNFMVDAGIPATNYGPGDFNLCHQPDEWVSTRDLLTCARVVTATALDLLG